MNKKSKFRTLFIILVIFVVGGAASYVLLSTGPEIMPKEKSSSAKIVQVIPMDPQTRSVAVTALGSVVPSRKVVIRPQVSGQVIRQSDAITIGGHVKENDEMIRIDSKDYELALSEVRSNLEQSRFEREVESGRQVIAKREWDELQADLDIGDVNRSLVLREPHLRKAEALMEKAMNDIEIAELQLSRTIIKAPFNAMVVEESVEVGQLLSPSSTICELVGTDEFWIQVTIPFSDLKWIRFPEENRAGAEAQVVLDMGNGESTAWKGEVIRLLSDLDPLGRMVRLVISVEDPLGLNKRSGSKLPLLLGSYVEVRMDAGDLENTLRIPREALREGNQIWVVGPDNLLKIVDADVLWLEKETVLISNKLEKGDQLIVSDLRVALPDMKVAPQPSTAYPELVMATQ
ncbi:MAG: efflux RND transporter periplasmic adaptor subunit [Opitutales bacterium]|jgi:RND family efflux transporter MFP subunit|nr:efflux RND transporter periplasmic adaptor subunit [Opitutales bacterium]MBT5167454.1 efflux RND transporter periplasmic adaptor subunit [Opitutales bacterium]MBT5816142.1 efflux RND transporter periplasmic adaptor subunit [Opitutales bacterium]MBT6769448.1 efflux RND transporter periplasmic adaptor subunit [Opitutales bacterium]